MISSTYVGMNVANARAVPEGRRVVGHWILETKTLADTNFVIPILEKISPRPI